MHRNYAGANQQAEVLDEWVEDVMITWNVRFEGRNSTRTMKFFGMVTVKEAPQKRCPSLNS
jgi:hypothetical protein